MPDRPLTGLVVAVPEAEPAVADLRLRLDANAALGAPAHVTVLFPFVPADELDRAVLDRLTGLFADVAPFDHTFSRTAWFEDRVLWLAPDDAGPFRALTERVLAAYPQHRPYEGAHGDDVVPHLTVGHEHPREVLAAAEREVVGRLPVTGTATEVLLLAQDVPDGRWTTRATFPLSGRPPISRR